MIELSDTDSSILTLIKSFAQKEVAFNSGMVASKIRTLGEHATRAHERDPAPRKDCSAPLNVLVRQRKNTIDAWKANLPKEVQNALALPLDQTKPDADVLTMHLDAFSTAFKGTEPEQPTEQEIAALKLLALQHSSFKILLGLLDGILRSPAPETSKLRIHY